MEVIWGKYGQAEQRVHIKHSVMLVGGTGMGDFAPWEVQP